MKALKIAGIVVAVLLLIIIAIPFLINVNSFRPKLESALTEALGREVKVGNLSLSILSGSVSAEDLSIADDPAFSKDAFIRAKSLKVGVEVMPLIFSKGCMLPTSRWTSLRSRCSAMLPENGISPAWEARPPRNLPRPVNLLPPPTSRSASSM